MKRIIGILLCLMYAVGAMAKPVHGVACAPTAEAAILRMMSKDSTDAEPLGFRVKAVRFDSVHAKAWAIVASCTEPSQPMIAVQLPSSAVDVASHQSAIVHTGERVTVLAGGVESRIVLTGWAMNAGAKDEAIDVRLGTLSDGDITTRLKCVVLKPGVVEVVR